MKPTVLSVQGGEMKKKILTGYTDRDFELCFRYRKEKYFSSRQRYSFERLQIPTILKNKSHLKPIHQLKKIKVRITIEELK